MTAFIAPKELKVGIDVGSLNHAVAISDDRGNILKEFEITHTNKGFASFFKIIEKVSHSYHATVSIAMEGYNGWARPLDENFRVRRQLATSATTHQSKKMSL